MKLEGIHHVTCITADAPGNVEFYAGLLGLRLVKKTVNQDDPTVYHLFYADEKGSAGADITFFEYPGVPVGRAGDGMVHTVVWRVGSEEALDFWAARLAAADVATEREPGRLRFADPEGLSLELARVETEDEPLVASHPEIADEHSLQGFDGVRAYTSRPEHSRQFLEGLSFEPVGDQVWEARGEQRGGWYAYDAPPAQPGLRGAGTVHHVAWGSPMDEHEAWRRRAQEVGGSPTPVIDRFYFRSIYFREPSGVLFEIATLGPGFMADEPLESLGEALSLPPNYEHLRDRLEQVLTPLPGPAGRVARVSLPARIRPAAGEPEGALVLFHGRGADEVDLVPLLDLLDPDRRLLGVTPRAPLALPPGGAHWYAVHVVGAPDPATFLPTFELASTWLDRLAGETGIPPDRTVLGGFSQGAVMSHALGLAKGRPRPAAIAGFSGFLPRVEGFELDLGPPLPPIAIGHGTYDPIIDVEFGRAARRVLDEAGADVLYREYPLPHAIDPRFATEVADWIRRLDAWRPAPAAEPARASGPVTGSS